MSCRDAGGFRSQGRPRSPAGRPLTLEPQTRRPARRADRRARGSSNLTAVVGEERWGFCLTTCTSAAGTARVLNVLTGVARAPARDGPVSSKCVLGGTPERAARIYPGRPAGSCWVRAGQPPSRSSIFHSLISAASRPKYGGTGWPTRAETGTRWLGCRPGARFDAPAAGGQPPKGQDGAGPRRGPELPRCRWVPISGPPPISGGPPADAGTPRPDDRPARRPSSVGQFNHHGSCEMRERGCPPNDLRFCCGGLRRPPPSHQTYPARGRRAQAPVSSKRGLDSARNGSERD